MSDELIRYLQWCKTWPKAKTGADLVQYGQSGAAQLNAADPRPDPEEVRHGKG